MSKARVQGDNAYFIYLEILFGRFSLLSYYSSKDVSADLASKYHTELYNPNLNPSPKYDYDPNPLYTIFLIALCGILSSY